MNYPQYVRPASESSPVSNSYARFLSVPASHRWLLFQSIVDIDRLPAGLLRRATPRMMADAAYRANPRRFLSLMSQVRPAAQVISFGASQINPSGVPALTGSETADVLADYVSRLNRAIGAADHSISDAQGRVTHELDGIKSLFASVPSDPNQREYPLYLGWRVNDDGTDLVDVPGRTTRVNVSSDPDTVRQLRAETSSASESLLPVERAGVHLEPSDETIVISHREYDLAAPSKEWPGNRVTYWRDLAYLQKAKGRIDAAKVDLTTAQAAKSAAQTQLDHVNAALVAVTHPTVGDVEIQVNVTGATVTLDGSLVGGDGTTFMQRGVTPGSHTVAATLAGYDPYSRTVNVNAGQTLVVSATLSRTAPTTGDVQVRVNVTGATVTLDGSAVSGDGTTFVQHGVAPGLHTVAATLAGYDPYSQSVLVNAGQTLPVTVTLNLSRPAIPTTSDVEIRLNVDGATVTLDGQPLSGPGPVFIARDVAPGIRTVLATKAGYADTTEQVQVSAGQHVILRVTLAPSSAPPVVMPKVTLRGVSNVLIFIDGIKYGTEAHRLDPVIESNQLVGWSASVAAGTHVVQLRVGEDDSPYSSQTVTVPPDATVSVPPPPALVVQQAAPLGPQAGVRSGPSLAVPIAVGAGVLVVALAAGWFVFGRQ